MNALKGGLIFAAGASVGAGVTWFFMNKKVKEANEDVQKAINEVKAAYSNSEKNQEMKHAFGMNFTGDVESEETNAYEEAVEEAEEPMDIYKISSEDFDANDEDMRVFLTYYKLDDIVVYSDTMIPIDHPEILLGDYFRDSFMDDDVVYIKNENEGALYELLLDDVNSLSDATETETVNIFDTVESEPIAEGGD